ncbi:exonuclease SbcCD subunit D [Mycobacterium sp. CBMA271]|uniref:metallophosphoesterase family protein n=1 Tax=unclassified Mycobacteroides TaxID=2618759 RepID=UPI001324BEFE|nr:MULTISPECIES: exonuclease SbcCD subunit D [unclassified Mycobacteroides]MUM16331.1 DNA repair exonuclease [Mycobacteroides sp. CBMA 326]MUM22157.1 exonuclease SbcCD subunit D [Mycobacteroides sp. CBMA 271]
MKFLHTADWQLGMTRHFLAGEAQPQYSAARREVITSLGDVAVAHGCDFMVVCGDVFESNQLAPRVISQALEVMRGVGVDIYLLPGNHDPLDAASVYSSELFLAEKPSNVHVLDAAGVHRVADGVELVAVPWRSKAPTHDLVAEQLEGLTADGTRRIVVAHGGVDVLDPDPTKPALIALQAVEDAIARGAVHYVALGDKHSRTEVGPSGRVWYSGAPEVTNYDDVESDPGHALVVDMDESGAVQVNTHHVGRWRFVTLRRSVDNPRDIADLGLNLELFEDKERTVVRHALTGTLSVTDNAMLEECLDKYTRLFASLRPWERHTDIAVVPADGEFSDLGVGGFAETAIIELKEMATGGGAASEDAQGALSLLLRLASSAATRRGSAA